MTCRSHRGRVRPWTEATLQAGRPARRPPRPSLSGTLSVAFSPGRAWHRLGAWLATFRGPAGQASTLARSSGWIGLKAPLGRWRPLAGASSALSARGWSSTGSFRRGMVPGPCLGLSCAACGLLKSTYTATLRTRWTRCCPGDCSSVGWHPPAWAATLSWCPAALRAMAGHSRTDSGHAEASPASGAARCETGVGEMVRSVLGAVTARRTTQSAIGGTGITDDAP